MSNLPPPPPPPPPGRGSAGSGPSRPQRNSNNNAGGGNRPPTPPGETPKRAGGVPRWALYVLGAVLVLALFLPSLWPSNSGDKIDYTTFMNEVIAGKVDTAEVNNSTARITGELQGRHQVHAPPAAATAACPTPTRRSCAEHDVDLEFKTPGNNWFLSASPACSCRSC